MKKGFLIFSLILMTILALFSIYIHRSLDGLEGFILSIGKKDETFYSEEYSDSKYKKIKVGMNKNEVKNIIGEPIKKIWKYDNISYILLEKNIVSHIYHKLEKKGIKIGFSEKKILNTIGFPLYEVWTYSSAPRYKNYSVRAIYIKKNLVIKMDFGYHVN